VLYRKVKLWGKYRSRYDRWVSSVLSSLEPTPSLTPVSTPGHTPLCSPHRGLFPFVYALGEQGNGVQHVLGYVLPPRPAPAGSRDPQELFGVLPGALLPSCRCARGNPRRHRPQAGVGCQPAPVLG